MDTFQFITEMTKAATYLAWPIAAVYIAYVVRDILNDDDSVKPLKPKEPPNERNRNPHPPAPTYPPRE